MSGKLSEAQRRALDKISQSGGHGFGEFAYLGGRTVAVLERLGLVTVGRKTHPSRPGRSMPWAIAKGADEPYGFTSSEESRRQWAEWSVRNAARREARTVALLERCRALRVPEGKPVGAEWEEGARALILKVGITKVEAHITQREA
jgi:hypothetical protein